MSTIAYRLRIRDAADTTDVLVVSSVRGDTHPDAIDAPSGDGAEFDPVTGSYRSGSMTFRIADSITSGTSRVVTAQLEDATFRQQLTSRPAYIEESVDGGVSWAVIQAGIVTALRLGSAVAWEIDVGDTARATRNLVAFAPKRRATDATKVEAFTDYLTRWPTRGCIAGGPILGGFLGRTDLGGWEMKVTRSTTWNGIAVKALEIDAAYFPSDFGRTANPSADQITPVDNAAGPAAKMPLTQTFADDFSPSPWPDLIVKVGTHYYTAASFAMAGDTWFNPKVGGALIGVSKFSGYWTLYLFDPAGTLPAVGTVGLRMSIFDALPSERSTIFYQGHPLDLWTKLCDESALRYDSAAVTATKALLGNNLRITLEITAPQDWASFVESTLYGPCGFSVRTATDGTLVPFTTRTGITALPSVTVTNADVPQEGNALFELSEPDAITKVTFTQTNLSHSATSDENLPLDGLARQAVQVIRTSGDAGGPVQREQTYTIPGFLDTGSGAYEPGLVDAMAKSLFDRFGRGRLTGEMTLLRGGTGGSVVLGQEILVALRAMPNHNKRYGDDNTVGGRCVQIVRLTPGPSGPRVRFVDSGPNANPASPLPTLSLAAGPPGAGLALTITNAATLNAATPPITVRVQWAAVPSGSPSSSDYTDVLLFQAGAVPSGVTLLPLSANGTTVYVQARSEDALHRPSAWTTPTSLAASALGAPTGLSVTPDGSDGSRATVAWTTGTNAGGALTDIYLRLSTLTFPDAIRRVAGLLAGTISFPLAGLIPTLSYIVSVVHRDAVTGATTKTEFTFTAGSTTRTLSPPTNPVGIVGSTDPVTGVGRIDGTYGLNVTAVELPGFVTFWEAIETGIGTGTYGSFTQVSGMVPSVSGGPTTWRGTSANALLRKQLKARHEADGTNPSTYTSVVTLDAWGVVQSPPPVDAISPPTAQIDFVSEDDTQVTLATTGAVGSGGSGPLQYAWRTGSAAWSAFSTTHANQSVGRANKVTVNFQLQVKQADGQVSAIVSYPVTGELPQVDPTTGLVGGLDASGLVTHPVPLPFAVANIPAISGTSGKLLPSVALDGTTGTPVHTQHAVSVLTDGPTVADGADRARNVVDTSYQVWAPAAKPVAVGTPGSPASLTKTVRIAFPLFQPASSGTGYTRTPGYLGTNTAGTFEHFAPVYVPVGATITSMRFYSFLSASAGSVNCQLQRKTDTGSTSATVANGTNTTLGGWTSTTVACSETVSSSFSYIIDLTLGSGTDSSLGAAGLSFVEITYTIPDYAKGI